MVVWEQVTYIVRHDRSDVASLRFGGIPLGLLRKPGVGSVFAHAAPQHGAAQRAREMRPTGIGPRFWRRTMFAWNDLLRPPGFLIATVSYESLAAIAVVQD